MSQCHAESRQSDLRVKNLHFNQAAAVCKIFLLIFLYGSECWAVTKRHVLNIDALNVFAKAVRNQMS